MKIPKSIWVIVLWILILAGFLFYQQAKLTNGHDIWVKPVPVDPRDLFRGDYVIFSYDFSTFRKTALNEPIPEGFQKTVYAILKNNGTSYVLDKFSFTKPSKESVFLKGLSAGDLYDGAPITYNIESFFVPEGTGTKFEQAIGGNLLVKIHVNPNGEAFIKETNINNLSE